MGPDGGLHQCTTLVDELRRKKTPETESPDLKRTSEEWQVPMKRVESTCVKTRAGSRQFMGSNKFEAIAEQHHDTTTRQDRFECDSDASTSCGSGCTEKCEMDPNLVGILLSSLSPSDPLCEMSSEWTPMPQPLVVDSGAAETVIPRTLFPYHKTVESEASMRGVLYTTADSSTVENEEVDIR